MKATVPTPHVPEEPEDGTWRDPEDLLEDIKQIRFPGIYRGVGYAPQ